MYNFNYQRPASVADAAALAASGAKLLAGGQTLVASLKLRLADPGTVADLGGLRKELSYVRREGERLVVGALTTHAEVAENAEVRAAIPALADLAGHIGDKQVRARGTMGGSVANNDPAACYPSAVLALGATVHTNRRTIAADDFFTGMYATALEEGELITAIAFPIPKRAAYMKFRQPASRFALVGVFVADTASGVRVAVTGAKSCVYREAAMEAALSASFTPEAAEKVAVAADDLNADLHASAAYRANLIRVMTARAVAKALG
jgi:carbon-monoxide dehydrogenase medium subunit